MRKKVPATEKEGVGGIAPLRSVLEICARFVHSNVYFPIGVSGRKVLTSTLCTSVQTGALGVNLLTPK